jgi:hypothetical protein
MQPVSPAQRSTAWSRATSGSPPQGGARLTVGPGPGRQKKPRGRWIWTISGVVVISAMIAPVGLRLAMSGDIHSVPMASATPRTLAIGKSYAHLSVQSYGGNIRVFGGGSGTQATARVEYDPQQGPPPAITASVSDGQLSLAVPSCAAQGCIAWFTVIVPPTVSVTTVSGGGDVVVSGVAGANLDSGGGTVTATSIRGPLTVASEGGSQDLRDIHGPLRDDSGGGAVVARGITGSSAVISTDGGQLTAQQVAAQTAILSSGGNDAQIGFSAAPASADITTDGGRAFVVAPGGPYAVTADSGGGNEGVAIPSSPTATSTLTVITGGGGLFIVPTSTTTNINPNPSFLPNQYADPVAPPAPPAPPASAAL